jgi:hypothetical protein
LRPSRSCKTPIPGDGRDCFGTDPLIGAGLAVGVGEVPGSFQTDSLRQVESAVHGFCSAEERH